MVKRNHIVQADDILATALRENDRVNENTLATIHVASVAPTGLNLEQINACADR